MSAVAVRGIQPMLNTGGGGSGRPRMEGRHYGVPISQLPSHTKTLLYGGRGGGPFSWRQGVSQQALGEMYKHNITPPGGTGAYGQPAVTVNEAARALKIAKNLDPEYQPDGTLRPPPVPPEAATGTPIDVSQGAVPTDVSAIPQQSASATAKIEAIRQQFLASQGLQPAGANLVNLLAQQQAARFGPNIESIRRSFLTG